MKVESVPTSYNVVNGEKRCVYCSNNFEYVAHVNGETNLDELKMMNPNKGVTNQVIVIKKSLVNNQQPVIDIEITVRCPHCHSNNRFSGFFSNSDKVTEL